jgi:glyoxylase-like metal-dependent hydrolase (beta-lactamase superfamily II)
MSNALEKLAPDLWIVSTGFFSAEWNVTVPVRMTVIRLKTGRLLIHSPVPIGPELRSAVEALGRPAALIAPNVFHHLFISEWKSAFPAAKIFCVPGLEIIRSDIKFDDVLENVAAPEWRGEVDQIRVGGIPMYGEMAFFHRSSRTLIVSDIVFNYTAAQAASDPGVAAGFGPDGRIKAAITDPNAARASVESILRWPFERVILAHGDIVESGGHARFREGFAFLTSGG